MSLLFDWKQGSVYTIYIRLDTTERPMQLTFAIVSIWAPF